MSLPNLEIITQCPWLGYEGLTLDPTPLLPFGYSTTERPLPNLVTHKLYP